MLKLPPSTAPLEPRRRGTTRPAKKADTAVKPVLGDLRRSVDDSAKQLRTSFIWFVTVSMYFAVLVGTTTHEQLFIGQSIKIPVVDVTLPIDAVYLVSPIIYAVVLVSMLVQADGLGQILKFLEAELVRLPRDRRRIEAMTTTDLAIVNLYLRTSDSHVITFLTWSIFVISFFVIPLTIMLLFQLNFLPYKHPWLTYFHMSLVATTTVVAVYFWFRFSPALKLRGRGAWLGNILLVVLPATGAVLVLTSALILVPERSWIDSNVGDVTLADLRTKVKRSLDLRGLAIGEDSKVFSMNNRDYSNADFSGARLTNVELINPTLDGAEFQRAVLRKVRFMCSDNTYGEFTDPDCSIDVLDMSGAVLNEVRMEGFSIGLLNLRSAIVANSRLRVEASVANLYDAKMWASTLGYADSASDATDQIIDWAYVGNAMLYDSKLFVKRVSGAHRLALGIKAKFAAAGSADEIVFADYFGAEEPSFMQRRWALAFEPHISSKEAFFSITKETKVKAQTIEKSDTGEQVRKTETIETVERVERVEKVEHAEKEPSIKCKSLDKTRPFNDATDCFGTVGYNVGNTRALRIGDFVSALSSAEDACRSALPGAALRTGITSFMDRVLAEQISGRNLSLLTVTRLPTVIREPARQFDFANRVRNARNRLESLEFGHRDQLTEVQSIWAAVAESPCICEKLASANDEWGSLSGVFPRVAANLEALKNQAYARNPFDMCAKTITE